MFYELLLRSIPVESRGFLLLACVGDCNITQRVPTRYHGSGLKLDSMIAENREKDGECVLFCNDPSVAAYYKSKFRGPALVRQHAAA